MFSCFAIQVVSTPVIGISLSTNSRACLVACISYSKHENIYYAEWFVLSKAFQWFHELFENILKAIN